MASKEKGYVYFQDFIPNNNFDIRVIVIDNKAFAVKRYVRKKDFRASGSGKIAYGKEHFSSEIIMLSFELSEKLKTQCVAFDYVFGENGKPLVVEISYGFSTLAYDFCVGYWDRSLNFVEGSFIPQDWMIENIMLQITKNNAHSKKLHDSKL
jgi:hypothetical protein